jgi:alpha-tubulin suppressor-like RCC1 family protein
VPSALFPINVPNLISILKNIVQVTAGSSHSVVLNNNGDLFSFGKNHVIKLINLVITIGTR